MPSLALVTLHLVAAVLLLLLTTAIGGHALTCSGGTVSATTSITTQSDINNCAITAPITVDVSSMATSAGAGTIPLVFILNGSTISSPNYLLFYGYSTTSAADSATHPFHATVTYNTFVSGMIGFYNQFPAGTLIDVRYNDCNQINSNTHAIRTAHYNFFGTSALGLRGGSKLLIEQNTVLVKHDAHIQGLLIVYSFSLQTGSVWSLSDNNITLISTSPSVHGVYGVYLISPGDTAVTSDGSSFLYNNNSLYGRAPSRTALYLSTTVSQLYTTNSVFEINNNQVDAIGGTTESYAFVIDYYGKGTVDMTATINSRISISNNKAVLKSTAGVVIGISLGKTIMSVGSELAIENNILQMADESRTVTGIQFKLDTSISSGNININSNQMITCSNARGLGYVESGYTFAVGSGGEFLFTRNVVQQDASCGTSGVPPLLSGNIVPSGTGVFYLCPWNRYGDQVMYQPALYTAAMVTSFAVATDQCFTPTTTPSLSLPHTPTPTPTPTTPTTATASVPPSSTPTLLDTPSGTPTPSTTPSGSAQTTDTADHTVSPAATTSPSHRTHSTTGTTTPAHTTSPSLSISPSIVPTTTATQSVTPVPTNTHSLASTATADSTPTQTATPTILPPPTQTVPRTTTNNSATTSPTATATSSTPPTATPSPSQSHSPVATITPGSSCGGQATGSAGTLLRMQAWGRLPVELTLNPPIAAGGSCPQAVSGWDDSVNASVSCNGTALMVWSINSNTLGTGWVSMLGTVEAGGGCAGGTANVSLILFVEPTDPSPNTTTDDIPGVAVTIPASLVSGALAAAKAVDVVRGNTVCDDNPMEMLASRVGYRALSPISVTYSPLGMVLGGVAAVCVVVCAQLVVAALRCDGLGTWMEAVFMPGLALQTAGATLWGVGVGGAMMAVEGGVTSAVGWVAVLWVCVGYPLVVVAVSAYGVGGICFATMDDTATATSLEEPLTQEDGLMLQKPSGIAYWAGAKGYVEPRCVRRRWGGMVGSYMLPKALSWWRVALWPLVCVWVTPFALTVATLLGPLLGCSGTFGVCVAVEVGMAIVLAVWCPYRFRITNVWMIVLHAVSAVFFVVGAASSGGDSAMANNLLDGVAHVLLCMLGTRIVMGTTCIVSDKCVIRAPKTQPITDTNGSDSDDDNNPMPSGTGTPTNKASTVDSDPAKQEPSTATPPIVARVDVRKNSTTRKATTPVDSAPTKQDLNTAISPTVARADVDSLDSMDL